MPTCDNINKKALWESVYYFLERAVSISHSKAMISSDSELRRIIITDGLNWFLIDSSDIHAVTDGANYTPHVITEFIAKKAIGRAIIKAINVG